MTSNRQRALFGILAFALPAILVGAILSPLVPASKDDLAYLVIGNVLSWPLIILNFLFGSSDGSKQKTEQLSKLPDFSQADPGHVVEE